MKNSYEYTMLQSDFWNYLVSKSKALLDDMDNFQYSEEKFIEKIRSVDEQFLSFVWGMKFVAYEEEIVDTKKKDDAIEETLGINIIEQFVNNKTTILGIVGNPEEQLKKLENYTMYITLDKEELEKGRLVATNIEGMGC